MKYIPYFNISELPEDILEIVLCCLRQESREVFKWFIYCGSENKAVDDWILKQTGKSIDDVDFDFVIFGY